MAATMTGGQSQSKAPVKHTGSHIRRYQTIWGFLFISPWVLGFLIFYLIPIVASFGFSLYDFQLATPDEAQFVGFANWRRMLFDDPLVWESLRVTLLFAMISMPIGLMTALFFAILVNSADLLGRDLFRTLFYTPTMIPLIAAIFIWNGVLNPQTGWLNRLLEAVFGIQAVGVDGLRWLDNPWLVYIAYTYIGLWGVGNAMIILLAGLQGVPTDLYEAAKIDGAGWWRRLWHITIPMITPVIFYNLILGLVGLLQYFIVPWVLTGGSGHPEGSTRFYMIYFYQQGFTFANMGYGATLAWLMFIVALIITLILFGTSRRWVYYAGE